MAGFTRRHAGSGGYDEGSSDPPVSLTVWNLWCELPACPFPAPMFFSSLSALTAPGRAPRLGVTRVCGDRAWRRGLDQRSTIPRRSVRVFAFGLPLAPKTAVIGFYRQRICPLFLAVSQPFHV